MRAKLRVAGIILLLAALAGLILMIARPGLSSAGAHPLKLVAAAWLVFCGLAWLVRGAPVRLAVGLILVGGIALQVAALAGPPQNSSDLYRYIWDGRVQAAGIDPYLYAPGDVGVDGLRDSFLWSGTTGPGHYGDCVPSRPNSADPSDGLAAGCTLLNRPKVPTVYPPVAEAYFLAIQVAAPADDSTTPVQAAAAVFAVLVTVLLLFGLRTLGKDPRLAALWAWCPTVPLEAGQNGHVDVVGVALTLGALLLLARAGTGRPRTRGRVIAGGVLLGLAIATKVTPALVLPAVLRRGWALISASALTAVSLVYVPHVLSVGRKIIGFFPGYLNQEGYSNGKGFSVIGLFAQGKVATVVAVLILGAIALAIYRYGDPDQPWRGGVLMTSAALAVCTPHFQWYAILLVMLVALDGRPEWLTIAAGGYLANSPGLRIGGTAVHDPRLLGYGGGAAVACALALARYLITRRARARAVRPELATAPELETASVALSVPVTSDSAADLVLEPTALFPRAMKYPQGTPADAGRR
jgi:hypothetical protein